MRVPATDAKNNFGGLLELVLLHGRVEITKHGRVVAILVTPGEDTRMIPARSARKAKIVRPPQGFDD